MFGHGSYNSPDPRSAFATLVLVLLISIFAIYELWIRLGVFIDFEHEQSVKILSEFDAEIKNLEPVAANSHAVTYGDTCRAQKYGILQVIGTDAYYVLVRYIPPQPGVYGARKQGRWDADPCPQGAIFFTTKRHFIDLLKKQKEIEGLMPPQ